MKKIKSMLICFTLTFCFNFTFAVEKNFKKSSKSSYFNNTPQNTIKIKKLDISFNIKNLKNIKPIKSSNILCEPEDFNFSEEDFFIIKKFLNLDNFSDVLFIQSYIKNLVKNIKKNNTLALEVYLKNYKKLFFIININKDSQNKEKYMLNFKIYFYEDDVKFHFDETGLKVIEKYIKNLTEEKTKNIETHFNGVLEKWKKNPVNPCKIILIGDENLKIYDENNKECNLITLVIKNNKKYHVYIKPISRNVIISLEKTSISSNEFQKSAFKISEKGKILLKSVIPPITDEKIEEIELKINEKVNSLNKIENFNFEVNLKDDKNILVKLYEFSIENNNILRVMIEPNYFF